MKNDDKNPITMQTPSQETERDGGEGAPSHTAVALTDPENVLECLHKECKRLFQQDFLIFLNGLVDRNGEERLIYLGIEAARRLFKPGLDEQWNILATAEMALPESKESKHFLQPASPPPTFPRELSEYFKVPHVNPWQAIELLICQSVLKNIGHYHYLSFASSSSRQVAHIVFGRNEQVPQIGQIGPCLQTH